MALFVQGSLLVADQRDDGVGGSGAGGGRRSVFDPLRMHAGDSKHPNQPYDKQAADYLHHD